MSDGADDQLTPHEVITMWVDIAHYSKTPTPADIATAILEALDVTGYAVVPKEPTDEYCEAIHRFVWDARFCKSGETYPVVRSYHRAIVAAASEGEKG
jgi:hypothetical protein